jgi:hypothetical protein
LGSGGYSLKHPLAIVASGSFGHRLISFLHPTFVVTSADSESLFRQSEVLVNDEGFVLTLSGSFSTDTSAFTGNALNQNSTDFSASVDPNSDNFIGNVFGYNPYGTNAVYNYVCFTNDAEFLIDEYGGEPEIIIQTGSAALPQWDFTDDYLEASTPWITSQKIGGNANNLFKIHTLSHGVHSNYEIKIGIANIKPAGTIAGSEYGEFDVVVRFVDQSKLPQTPFTTQDDDIRPNIVESFRCNLDPNSPKFISRVIGDRYVTINDEGKVIVNGDYSSASYVSTQVVANEYNRRIYYGFDYSFGTTDNFNYLRPLPTINYLTTGSSADFYLGNYDQDIEANYPSSTSPYSGPIDLSSNTSIDSRKFMVPFQGGFDGHKPNLQKKTGAYITAANTQGVNITNANSPGYTSYKKALDTISNADEFDINMIVTPGVLHSIHPSVTNYAKSVCEDRGDAFYVMDSSEINDNINTIVSTVEALDTNYAATYYPWVKILDTDRNKPVWVPPSVVLPGVIAFNDRVSAEWFAPAGLNRGGLTEVIEVKSRLTQTERDVLYEGRVNPIATFPSTGVCVWGQKTLQGRPSALDRINVRRLLIAAKKFIASSTRYLVFEQNTSQTRARFLNIVNPYLESIQQRQGLFAFRVIMDESNNTPDIIDRNILYGQLFLQPTRTAEFIVLDFNVQSTGAAFPGA